MQLVLIEGTHGTGKSTLGRALAKQLESMGKVVALYDEYDEYDRSNPINTWAINMMRKSPSERSACLSGENTFCRMSVTLRLIPQRSGPPILSS